MAASAVGIFAQVKGLVDWTQGIINTLGIYIKAGIDSPWGFDLKGFVDLFAPFSKLSDMAYLYCCSELI